MMVPQLIVPTRPYRGQHASLIADPSQVVAQTHEIRVIAHFGRSGWAKRLISVDLRAWPPRWSLGVFDGGRWLVHWVVANRPPNRDSRPPGGRFL